LACGLTGNDAARAFASLSYLQCLTGDKRSLFRTCRPNFLKVLVCVATQKDEVVVQLMSQRKFEMQYENPQDRSAQPGRLNGGNCADAAGAPSGSHGSKRGVAIGSKAALAEAKQNEQVRGGGNCAEGESREKHDQPKAEGKHFIGDKLKGAAEVVEAEIQVSERRHGAGNSSEGAREKTGQKKAKHLDLGVHRL
jgi:hypothetical protein